MAVFGTVIANGMVLMTLVTAAALLCGSCQPSARDLTVTNAWWMPITVEWSPDFDTPLDKWTRLGDVAPDQTAIFRAALPTDQMRYVLHGRYDNNQFEFLTLCYDHQGLERLEWHVSIPPQTGGSSTC